MSPVRVAKFRADMALDLLPIARDNQDNMVINACIRVRQAYMLGRKVDQADLDLVEEFTL